VQHQVSHPFAASHAPAARQARSIVVTMPNARDERYPRSWAIRVVRAVASIWWMPFVSIFGYAGVTSALLAANASAGPTLGSLAQSLAAALGLDGLVPALQAQAWLMVIPAATLLALGACMVVTVRWAADDRVREARTLLMREVSPQEQANATWMRNAFAPALDWRVRCLLRRRMLTGLLLTAAALVLGTLVALLVAGAHLSLAAVL
jgi:hypothetical protein